jgi:hypothetical protein
MEPHVRIADLTIDSPDGTFTIGRDNFPEFSRFARIFANWTELDELRPTVRHEAAHLAFARTHTPEESAGHSGPSEEFARAFELAPG